jgi:hypothetical protein
MTGVDINWLDLLADEDQSVHPRLREEHAIRSMAVVLGVKVSDVVYQTTVDGRLYTSGNRTLELRIEPADAPSYDAELMLGPEDPMVPAQPGTRFTVLVSPDDRELVGLTDDRWFVLPGGIVWQQPFSAR